MDHQGVSNYLLQLAQEEQQIKRDPSLSDTGREAALKKFRAGRDQFRPQAHSVLKSAWGALRARYHRLESERQALELEESKRWDYGKLGHERDTLRAKLEAAIDLGEIEAIYGQYERSGVPERRLALFELTPEFAVKHKSGSLAKQAERALADLRTTPELAKNQEQGGALVQEAQALDAVTRQTSAFFGQDGGLWGSGDEFSELMTGITITQRGDPERGMIVSSLSIAPD